MPDAETDDAIRCRDAFRERSEFHRAVAMTRLEGRDLLAAFLESRTSAKTRKEYGKDLAAFGRWLDVEAREAVAAVVQAEPGEANALGLAWRSAMQDEGLAPATINRRLSALRSVVSLAGTLGLISWSLSVPGLKVKSYRDTAGPGADGVRRMLAKMAERTDAKGLRDLAAVRLLYDLGLRRSEVVGLDLEHVDPERGTIAVLGKGQTQRERLTLPPETVEALSAWVEARGDDPGPLFVSLDRRGHRGRLTGRSLARIVKAAGRKVGLADVSPHGLRHAAVTAALDATDGDVRAVQRFSRHADVSTVLRYDDNREDLGGRIARIVAAGV